MDWVWRCEVWVAFRQFVWHHSVSDFFGRSLCLGRPYRNRTFAFYFQENELPAPFRTVFVIFCYNNVVIWPGTKWVVFKANWAMKQTKGFTLIELLVAMFILLMITSLTLANFRSGERQKRAVIATDTVVNALRNAQNFTLTGKNTTNSTPSCRTVREYIITISYSSPVNLSAYNTCGTLDPVETYTLPAGTRIKASGLVLDGTTAASSLSFAFYPPFGIVKANRGSGAYNNFTTARITIETLDGAFTRTIEVNGVSGRIGE
jgi:prepilin-type N-terminal cleavage/methylation domain-containing protein